MDASIPHQYCSYDNYPFSAELFGLSTPADDSDAGKLNAIFNDKGANMINNIVPSILNYDINSPVSAVASSQFGVSDGNIVVPQMSPEFDFGFSDNFAACDYNQLHQVFVKGEEYCSGLVVPNFCPAYINPIPTAETWGIIQGKPANKVDVVDNAKEVKVGKYSVEEKKDRILRYLKKRNQRNFNKTIKYACRKTLADKRVRIRGRFAKNNESCSEEETATMNTSNDTCGYEENNNNNSLYDNEQDSFLQMKYDDEDYWFDQAASMANLVQLPYLAS